MTKFKFVLTDMAPNGCNDLLILNEEFEIIDTIEECCFGYPSNTRIKPDLSIDYTNTIGDASVLRDLEMGEAGVWGLYSVSMRDILKRIAVSPINDGQKTIQKLKRFK